MEDRLKRAILGRQKDGAIEYPGTSMVFITWVDTGYVDVAYIDDNLDPAMPRLVGLPIWIGKHKAPGRWEIKHVGEQLPRRLFMS